MKKDAQSLHEHIRLEAFLLSEKAGHPTGMDEFFWTQAEAMVQGRTAVVVGPGKPSKTKPKTVSSVKKATKAPVSVEGQSAPKAIRPVKPKVKSVGKRAK